MLTIVVIGVVLALVFDFLNGMNDAANSIATIVSTRVLPPRFAVAWAAFFNFVAVFTFGVGVATTIGKGIVRAEIVTPILVVGALIGANIWVYICTHWGLPISVSHALIGGLAGAGIAQGGFQNLITSGIIKVSLFIVISPVIGMIISVLLMIIMTWLASSWTKVKADKIFRRLQLVSSAIYSLSHGTNDAQKTMGIIAVLLYSAGLLGDTFYIPWVVIITCYSVIALGTLTGGWKVIRTMGTKLTKLRPFGGFVAETSGGIAIFIASFLGIPVSTTHTITGSIAGVGIVQNIGTVRWGVIIHIVWAWIFTIPASALIGGLIYYTFKVLFGVS
ncbi:inorganic phosphate transporter [bacterium]|nr:inorganic phosphate transporter [bacterium]